MAAAIPDRPAVVCGDRRLSFSELDRRADALAHHLKAAGVGPGEHVGVHMLNSVEFVETLLACLKIRAVPINVNYRYTDRELHYLYNDAELVALVVDEEFAPAVARVAGECPTLRHVIVLEETASSAQQPGGTAEGDAPAAKTDHGSGASATWTTYGSAMRAPEPDSGPAMNTRTADDHYVLYTGGTTGMPKGVVWRHEDFYFAALSGGNPFGAPHQSAEALARAAAAGTDTGPIYLVTAPLMHGAASYTLLTALFSGSLVVLTRRFDPVEVLRLVEREATSIVTVVGDAIARPLLDAVRAHGSDYDLSAWKVLGSGGALLSRSVRQEAVELLPGIYVNDGFGASESGVDGSLRVGEDGLMRLAPTPKVVVVDERLRPLAPGSPEIGFIARTGHVPLGYYNDPEKTAKTFPVIDGVRWAVLGDMARVEADGSTVLLGRGSGCINTGGEKVFPEEVEQALKSHPAVMDALVAGVPDARFGERVGAVVEVRAGVAAPDTEELRTHCRTQVAGYKVPALLTVVQSIVRSPSGKADYRWAKRVLSGETN
ncbi:acyl-CoA synthetase [Streptosporangium carneum]|uniref:Acyl-CoA synthetase n=1 Tax=Streptosporangium carneum TaxID=47481 RepID=A0A9W6HZB5_9ACTN|nr:acyl-CoA synthetase [Streptosporangium carneum]